MSHDLTLAQKAAWHLARTLMAPVVLFQVDDEFGVLPADELDDADVEIQDGDHPRPASAKERAELIVTGIAGTGTWPGC